MASLLCPICFTIPDDYKYKLLSCLHNSCKACATSEVKKHGKVACVVCGAETKEADLTDHLLMKQSGEHGSIAVQDKPFDKCEDCKVKAAKHYCKNCSRATCTECAVDIHAEKAHAVTKIDNKVNELKAKQQAQVAEYQQHYQQLLQHKKQARQMMNDMKKKNKQLQAESDEYFASLRAAINKAQKDWNKQFDELQKQQFAAWFKYVDELLLCEEQLKHAEQHIQFTWKVESVVRKNVLKQYYKILKSELAVSSMQVAFDQQVLSALSNHKSAISLNVRPVKFKQLKQLIHSDNLTVTTFGAGCRAIFCSKRDITTFVDIGMKNVKQITSCSFSMFCVTHDGTVYARGKNEFGECGLGHKKEVKEWTKIAYFDGVHIAAVDCGCGYSMFLSSDGKVYSCGWNVLGQLGIGNEDDKLLPAMISHPVKCKMIKCAKGNISSFLVDENNRLYAFGLNNWGQLGIGSKNDKVLSPTEVTFFRDKSPICVIDACGHSAVVLLEDGSVYAMGDKNKCGQVLSNHACTPVLVTIPMVQTMENTSNCVSKIVSLCCSDYATIVGTNDNQWFAFGDAELAKKDNHPGYGKAVSVEVSSLNDVLPKDGKTNKPMTITKMIASYRSYMLLTDDNELYGVGNNESGILGLGHTSKVTTWQKIGFPTDECIVVNIQEGAYTIFCQIK